MILGGCLGWLGFFKLSAFRTAWPMYAPLHVGFYLLHATQEHLTTHSSGKFFSKLYSNPANSGSDEWGKVEKPAVKNGKAD